MAIDKNDTVNMEAAAPAVEKSSSNKQNPIVHFLREVQVELKKTNWPTRDELTKYVVVVLLTIVVSTVILWLADTISAQVGLWAFKI